MFAAQALELCQDSSLVDDIRQARSRTSDETEIEVFDEVIRNLAQ